MEPIQIIGMDKIEDQLEIDTINKIANDYYDKVERLLKNATSISLHVKAHSKGGKQKKWDLRVKVIAPTQIFESQESDWDLARTLHKVFKNVQKVIQHKLHVDDQRPKSYS